MPHRIPPHLDQLSGFRPTALDMARVDVALKNARRTGRIMPHVSLAAPLCFERKGL